MHVAIQAYVINEEENDVLGSDDRSFEFLAHELSSAVSSDESRSVYGYRTDEVLAAINKLSVHDSNKSRIIRSGVLDSFVCLLSSGRSTIEQLLATQGLWTLAMGCPQDVAKQDGCVQSKLIIHIIFDLHHRHWQKSVVSVVSCRFPNSITTTCCGIVAEFLAVSLTSPQQIRNKPVNKLSAFPYTGNVCNGFWALTQQKESRAGH